MTTKNETERHFTEHQPDAFDRAYGQAQGFAHAGPSTKTEANLMGIGGVRSYIVETFRVPEVGDIVFVTITGPEGLQRVHLPPSVSTIIARQREALTTKIRSRSAKARYQADKLAAERANPEAEPKVGAEGDWLPGRPIRKGGGRHGAR
jgi:hypothetical protein